MAKSIRQIFDEHCDRVKINRRLIQQIHDIRVGFVNRNQDSLNFFSSNLLGVYPIRYRPEDRQRWCEEILEVDEVDIQEELKHVPYLKDNQDWVRANDVVNLSCIWLLHQIKNSDLSDRDKTKGLVDVCLMLQYKFISSVMAHYFQYQADPAVAEAAKEALSQKFQIKQYGSWQALLEQRCRVILDRDSIHYKTYNLMDDDGDVVYMVNDVQQRIKEVVKSYTKVFHKVKEQNLRINRSSTVIEIDGEIEIAERTRDHTAYTRYLKDIITDKQTFIRRELFDVITDAVHTVNEQHLYQALSYCSDNYGRGGDKNIEVLVDETLLHAFRYLSENQGVMSSPDDLATLLNKLKNLYSASRMSDPQLIKMRDTADKIINRSVKTRNRAAQASARTACQLYLVIRAFTKKHYDG